jgi:hypothetical protein
MPRRQGDWMCEKCKFLIYGKKDKCFKCGTLKPNTSNLKNNYYHESANLIWSEIELAEWNSYSEEYKKRWITPCPNHPGKATIANCWKCN